MDLSEKGNASAAALKPQGIGAMAWANADVAQLAAGLPSEKKGLVLRLGSMLSPCDMFIHLVTGLLQPISATIYLRNCSWPMPEKVCLAVGAKLLR